MVTRAMLLGIIVVIEAAIASMGVLAVRGGPAAPWPVHASADRLVEDGAHRIFHAGGEPAVFIDVGYADVTVRTGGSSAVDVSLGRGSGEMLFHATAPIEARLEGATVRITSAGGWASGDNRRVTVVVPAQARVTVAHGGDIDASGLRTGASFQSVGRGKLTVDDFNGPDLHVASEAGRIDLRHIVAARIAATSDSGGILGSELRVRDGSIDAGGRVSLGFSADADTVVQADDDRQTGPRTMRFGAGSGHVNVQSDSTIAINQDG